MIGIAFGIAGGTCVPGLSHKLAYTVVILINPEHGLAGLVLFLAGYQVSNGIVGVQMGGRGIAADLLH